MSERKELHIIKQIFFVGVHLGYKLQPCNLPRAFLWLYVNERVCWTGVFYRAGARPLFWQNEENVLGHHTSGRRLPRGICTPNSFWFPLEPNGKRASSSGLEMKLWETRQPAQPGSGNGGWIWDVRRVKQHLQKSTVVQMQSQWVVTAGSPGWHWLQRSSVGHFHWRKPCRLSLCSSGEMWCLCWP